MKFNFLISFFNSLEIEKINYCVLRNYELLPKSTNGSDLDILINKSDSVKFIELIKDISERYNGKVVSYINSDICPRLCVMGYNENAWGVLIDLHYDKITYRGYTVFDNEFIFKNTFLFNEKIRVLDPKVDILNAFLKELLNNQKCKQKYFEDLKKMQLSIEFLNEVFKKTKNKKILINSFLQISKKDFSENRIQGFLKILNISFPKKNDVGLIIKKTKRLLNQPGYTIAFLGTDGSGKSTIIENIKPPLLDGFHKAVYYEHMRPNKFPSIAKLFGKQVDFNQPVTNPHGSSTSGFVGSLLRWLYYLLDYTFGFYLKIWPKKAIKSSVWLFDRYYYDYLIDPKRARIKLPHWILKLGQFLIPEPDLILCLGTEAKAIHKRKPELSLDEVERQVTVLKEFSNSHNRAIWIDTGNDIETSANDAMEAIINMMAKRFEKVNLSK